MGFTLLPSIPDPLVLGAPMMKGTRLVSVTRPVEAATNRRSAGYRPTRSTGCHAGHVQDRRQPAKRRLRHRLVQGEILVTRCLSDPAVSRGTPLDLPVVPLWWLMVADGDPILPFSRQLRIYMRLARLLKH